MHMRRCTHLSPQVEAGLAAGRLRSNVENLIEVAAGRHGLWSPPLECESNVLEEPHCISPIEVLGSGTGALAARRLPRGRAVIRHLAASDHAGCYALRPNRRGLRGAQLPGHAGDHHAGGEQQPSLEAQRALVVQEMLPPVPDDIFGDIDIDHVARALPPYAFHVLDDRAGYLTER